MVSVDKPELVQNNIKTETVTLNLDSEWEGLSTVINIGNKKPVSVIWSGEPVVIPAELMTTVGSLDVSVVGYGDDGGIRAVTKKATSIFNVVASGFVEGDEAVPDPTTILGQLTEAADRANHAADRFNQASEDIGDISDAVTEVEGYADSAKTSETNAASSATAASRSETNAAASASAAKVSETNAADSAAAAQNAVEGFGLEVGTTTTGDPGTDAAVEIQKAGTKYTASFTIPRGDVGPAGVNENVPLGSTSGVVAQGTDAYPTLPRKVQVHGRTIENLFRNFSGSAAGVTINCDESGLFSFSGTATSGGYKSAAITLKPNTKYTLSVYGNLTGINQVYVEYHVSSSDSTVWNSVGPRVSATTKTFVTASDITSAKCGFEFKKGENVTASLRVMLVEGDTVPDVFVPSGVHDVEPTKLIIAGGNPIDLSTLPSDFYNVSGDTVTIVSQDNRNWSKIPYSSLLPPGKWEIIKYGSAIVQVGILPVGSADYSAIESLKPSYSYSGIGYTEIKIKAFIGNGNDFKLQIKKKDEPSDYTIPYFTESNFPLDVSLADGDTLAIDRDGTTQIVHAEGEPTVLENVALPELPSPTFNVYTTGGYIQPTVDVDYEQDVNLVLQALKAKIASLEVTQTIMQGA